jgi:hypothetical protein
MYALVNKKKLIKYPVYPHIEHPHVSIPINWNGGIIDGSEYVYINRTTPGSVAFGFKSVEDIPVFENNRWIQTWKEVKLTVEEFKQILLNHLKTEYDRKMNKELEIEKDETLQITNELLIYLQGFENKEWELKNILIETNKEIKEIPFTVINYAVKELLFHRSNLTQYYLTMKKSINNCKTYNELKKQYESLSWPKE